MLKSNLSLSLVALLLAGCASRSADIAPAYVSPMLYQNYTCPQLQEEAARISAKAVEVSGAQDNKATTDAVATTVGVVVFWPALFFIKGDSTTGAEVANLKGQMDAIEQENIRKKCGIQFHKEKPADAPKTP